MAYDQNFPADNSFIADLPPGLREQLRAIIEDALVNALKVNGLSTGNAAGNIPVANGTLCTNLNAERLGGLLATAFALAGHTHALASGSVDGLLSAALYTKLIGIATGAEVNQNAFSNVLVSGTTVQADSKTDTLEIIPGTGITITPDAANNRLTIAVALASIFANAALTGTPTAPTATAGTNTTQIATTAFVQAALTALITSALGGDSNYATTTATALSNKQPLDATLTALAAITTAADKLIYSTGADAFSTTTLTGFARTLLDDVDAATARTTLAAAPLASPSLTGTPTAPTAAAGTNTTQIATTAFVQAALSNDPQISVDILTGSIAHGGTIPLPSGYTQAQCKWMVGVAEVPALSSGNWVLSAFNVSADANRVVTAQRSNQGGYTGNITAYYIIIGVK